MTPLQMTICLAICAFAGTVIGALIGNPDSGFAIGLGAGAAIAGVLIALRDEAA